ncbi:MULTISPECIES: rhodanese-like domain-containing protein [unclassified Simplicispira]|uniref:rhodanese-like domain-containing protein n=1 Tax=unclassified Simplicispira TaxID=2630407 RepID=UPI000D5D44BE|nr:MULTISPECIES: rhodanese-like domain-containing protein [unclassified Simplicispira]PVY55861.1 rhodanese-related sulfurtransferase [Simplicispira sp. 125]REG16804.1 rhodanese-related sulfurtransferase [Simplicispira sp. 110]
MTLLHESPQPPPAPTLVDVRSRSEFESGHVDGAVHLPLERLAQDALLLLPDKTAPMVLYCLSGARSGMALQWMRQLGYTQAVNGGSVGAVALQTGRGIRRL